MNMKVTGVLEVTDDAVLVGGSIPFAMVMFKGRMEKTMRDELRKLLA